MTKKQEVVITTLETQIEMAKEMIARFTENAKDYAEHIKTPEDVTYYGSQIAKCAEEITKYKEQVTTLKIALRGINFMLEEEE